MNSLQEFDVREWDAKLPVSITELAVNALERGQVIVLPHLPFELTEDEQRFLSEKWSNQKAKNISLRPASTLQEAPLNGAVLKGAVGSKADLMALQAMIARYSQQSMQMISTLFPSYAANLKLANTSYRPCQVENRASSYRKDDTRLHADAFPSNPTQGTRLLRVFTNINPFGQPRVWRVGEPFVNMAQKFLPRTRAMLPGQSWLMHRLGITKRRRTKYDQLMMQLHNKVKADVDYQQHAPQQLVSFMPGTTWIVYSDQVLHAAMSGQYMMEQTLHLEVNAMNLPDTSPIRVLELMLLEPLGMINDILPYFF